MLETVLRPAQIMSASMAGCVPIYPEPAGSRSAGCQDLNRFRYEFARDSEDVGAVVVAANWQWWGDPSATFEYLNSLGIPIVVMGPRPVYSELVKNIVGASDLGASDLDLSRYLRVDFGARNQELTELVQNYNNITLIDLWGPLCQNRCGAYTPSGAALYVDNVHLSPSGAVWLAGEVREQIEDLSASLEGTR